MKWFGREPAIFISIVYSLLMLLSVLWVRGIDETMAAAVQVLLTAVATALTALTVKPVAPTVFTGVIVAAAALAARFRFHLDENQIALAAAFVASVVTLVGARPQQTPVHDPADGTVVARDTRATL
jgi:hypothetical protein